MRPAWTCLIGIILAVALNKVHRVLHRTPTHPPVKSLAKACQTGHATNIIQGFAVGYETHGGRRDRSSPAAILLSVLIYAGTPPLFIAYGVAMCGIGMLTLTGNTISMDVFGPVADNANGIGEMGYDERGDGRGAKLQAGPADPGRPRRGGQHHQGRDQGHRHRLGRDRGRVAVRQLHRRRSRWAARTKISQHDRDAVLQRGRQADRRRSDGVHRHADRRRRAVPVQLDDDPRRGPGRLPHRQGVPHPVPRQGDLGRHEEARLRPRGRHLHQRRPEGTDRPGAAGHPRADPGRLRARARTPWAASWRHDRRRPAAGRLHGQRRRRLGQRQEDDRGRAPNRDAPARAARSTRPPSPATPSAIR